jgi:hypothetical protein
MDKNKNASLNQASGGKQQKAKDWQGKTARSFY